MEDDKKKRKNKKKKNKRNNQQTKANTEDRSSNAGETSSQDHNHAEEGNHSNQASETVSGGFDDSSNTIVDSTENQSNHASGTVLGGFGDWSNTVVEGTADRSDSNGNLCTYSADDEKHKWLQEEARLKEMVKQLLYEKNSYVKSQADLESSLKQLQFEIESWHQKEVSLEQRISQLVQEKANMSIEEGNLKEKIRHIEKEKFLLVENENTSKELTATVNTENTKLRMQVLELEGAQNSLSQENRQLLDNISALELRIQDLEKNLPTIISPAVGQQDNPEEEDLNGQVEAAFALVEKLVTENAELVEKLNELYMELERRRVVQDVSSMQVTDHVAVPVPISGSGEDLSMSSRSAKQFETVPIRDELVVAFDLDSDNANAVRHSSETAVSGEIVQIPLDENVGGDLEAQAFPSDKDEGESVPITDAPLIGAPFRLISFVAKYVSGADLVDNSYSESLLEH